MLTNIPGALSAAALLALLSTARRENSRFFHQRPHQIILPGFTSFGGLQRARVAAKRYHLDLHKRVERTTLTCVRRGLPFHPYAATGKKTLLRNAPLPSGH